MCIHIPKIQHRAAVPLYWHCLRSTVLGGLYVTVIIVAQDVYPHVFDSSDIFCTKEVALFSHIDIVEELTTDDSNTDGITGIECSINLWYKHLQIRHQ